MFRLADKKGVARRSKKTGNQTVEAPMQRALSVLEHFPSSRLSNTIIYPTKVKSKPINPIEMQRIVELKIAKL